jgi:hypothetical protein
MVFALRILRNEIANSAAPGFSRDLRVGTKKKKKKQMRRKEEKNVELIPSRERSTDLPRAAATKSQFCLSDRPGSWITRED